MKTRVTLETQMYDSHQISNNVFNLQIIIYLTIPSLSGGFTSSASILLSVLRIENNAFQPYTFFSRSIAFLFIVDAKSFWESPFGRSEEKQKEGHTF